jgi:hypothetical protein
LHQCIRPLIGAPCSGPSWISARLRSHYRTGLNGPVGSPVFAGAGECLTLLTSRARGLHQHRGSGAADTARLPLEGLSAFGGGRKDCKIATDRYPTTRRSGRRENTGPRLTRLGSGAREALTVRSAPISDGPGGWWGPCPNEQRSLVAPNNCVTLKGGTGVDGGYSWPRRKKTWGGGLVRCSGAQAAWSRSVRFSF